MIKDATNRQKTRKQTSGSKSGRSLAHSLKESGQQEAEAILSLRAKATAATIAAMVESGEYASMVLAEVSDIFSGCQAVLTANIEATDEAFLLPPSSSSFDIDVTQG